MPEQGHPRKGLDHAVLAIAIISISAVTAFYVSKKVTESKVDNNTTPDRQQPNRPARGGESWLYWTIVTMLAVAWLIAVTFIALKAGIGSGGGGGFHGKGLRGGRY